MRAASFSQFGGPEVLEIADLPTAVNSHEQITVPESRDTKHDPQAAGAHGEESKAVRVVLAMELGGIDSLELGDQPDPAPAAGQALIKVHGAGIGPWDVGFLSGGFPGLALPFVPGQEIAGVVEAAGDGAGVDPGERVYASLFPAGGGFAELALASADRLAPMAGQVSFQEAAALVIGAGTAYEGLDDRGRLQAGETVLITAAAGGVGSAAVQIAAAMGAHLPASHEMKPQPKPGWSSPLVPALRVLILRPDPPREDDVKGTIAAQLDAAQARSAAIRHDHHGAVPLLPGPAPGAKPGTLGGETA